MVEQSIEAQFRLSPGETKILAAGEMLRSHAAFWYAISEGGEAFNEVANGLTGRGGGEDNTDTLARAAHLVRVQLVDGIKGLGQSSPPNLAESARYTAQLEKLYALCARLGLSIPSQELRNTIVLSRQTGIIFERQGGELTRVTWAPWLGSRDLNSIELVRHDVSSHTIMMSVFSFVGVVAPPVLSHVDEEVVRGIEEAICSGPHVGILRDAWRGDRINKLLADVSKPLEEESPRRADRLMGSDLGIRINKLATLICFLLEREGFVDLRSLRHGIGEPMLGREEACLTVEAVWNYSDSFSGLSGEAREEIVGVVNNLNSLIQAANLWRTV